MENFEYYNPDRIKFGPGIRNSIGDELKSLSCKRVLITVGKGPFHENGLYDEIAGSIAKNGIGIVNIGDIDSNPRITSVREGVAACKKEGVDTVVAIGGGSTMDCSKVIAAAAMSGDDPWEHVWGHKKPFTQSLRTVMVPTLAATGTDVNPYAVIMDEDAIWKSAVTAECMYPDMTLCDPEIHTGVPISLTVWGAMDILSHTFEFYFNGYHRSIFQNRFSEAIVMSVMESLNRLVKDPRDIEARGELWWSSIMAWGGLTFLGRGGPDMACHDLAEGFVPFYDTHHGGTLGVITPRWMQFVLDRKEPLVLERFSRFARNVMGVIDENDERAARSGFDKYLDWLKSVGAPDTYSDLTKKPVSKEKMPEIVAKTYDDLGRGVGNISQISQDDALRILEAGCDSIL
jgi:alcohol dehydrogenase YqhD (iron-dependent ADH family)